MPILLAERLRQATRQLHAEVERAGIMQPLLRGQISRGEFAALLRNLHAIYAALEAGLQQRAGHPAVAPMVDPRLFRTAALAADLDRLHGPRWADALAITPAAAEYAHHLGQLAQQRPSLLAAHAYVRYLGDLSGGQVVARVVRQALGWSDAEPLRFYDFGRADEVKAMARAFRGAIDQLAADEAAAAQLVDEACAAFVRHKTLFEQLAPGAAVVTAG